MILIGRELEQAVSAIICRCDICVDWAIVDRIVKDSHENHVDAKEYVLHESRRTRLTATVQEYEPETVELKLDRGRSKHFATINEAAACQGFGSYAYFFESGSKLPRNILAAINHAHRPFSRRRPVIRDALIAVQGIDAISRCFLEGTGRRPTPYWVYATDLRKMQSRVLSNVQAQPYRIKGYR